MVRRERNEDGAMLVTAAILFVAVATLASVALAGGTLYGASEEGRRAADAAALAGAAALPTLNLGTGANPLQLPNPDQLDTPLGTVNTSGPLPAPGTSYASDACRVALEQFGGGASPLAAAYGKGPVSCQAQVGLDDPWFQQLADCLGSASACATDLASRLASQLPPPAPGSAVAGAVQSAAGLAGQSGQVVTDALTSQLDSLNTTLGGKLQPLLDVLARAGGIHVDLTALAPAVLTPNVTVELQQAVGVPGAGLLGAGPVTLHSRATARRAFKTVVVLPTLSLPDPSSPGSTQTFNPNTVLAQNAGPVFDALGTLDGVVGQAASSALQAAGCPPAGSCPSTSELLGNNLADLRDLVDPPAGGGPDPAQLLGCPQGTAVADCAPGRIALVVSSVVSADPRKILGDDVYSLPGVSTLLPGLLFIPALEFVPSVLSAGPLGSVVATPVDTTVDAAATRGLYRARLVR